jgi:heptosyltransferase-1
VKKLLVIKPSSLGDIIHGLQIVESIRAQSPDAHVTWVVETSFKAVVEACATVDAVIVFERKGGVVAFLRLLKKIRSQPYDTVLDLQGLARSGLMTFAARAQQKLGRADAREGAGLFYKQKVPLPEAKQAHAVEILAKFLPALGLQENVLSSLRFDFPDLAWDERLASLKGGILIFPESRRSEKEWPQFARFIQAAAEKYPQQTFAWCASERSADICPAADNIINLAGQTNLLQIIALIQEAAVVVANDSGPVHIAAAVGTPILGLYGPTPPALYGPYPLGRPSHLTIESGDKTMASIEIDTVMAALDQAVTHLNFVN